MTPPRKKSSNPSPADSAGSVPSLSGAEAEGGSRAESVVEATERAIAAEKFGGVDAGAVAVLRKLAAAVDAIGEEGLNPAGRLDNVTIPTYLRYADALGLTPIGRFRMRAPAGKEPAAEKSTTKPEAAGGKLVQFRNKAKASGA